jgi:hypothetical protein
MNSTPFTSSGAASMCAGNFPLTLVPGIISDTFRCRYIKMSTLPYDSYFPATKFRSSPLSAFVRTASTTSASARRQTSLISAPWAAANRSTSVISA